MHQSLLRKYFHNSSIDPSISKIACWYTHSSGENTEIIKDYICIFNAIHKGENIHTGDLKHNKLDMCDKAGSFGDWIANQTGGKEFERKIDDAIFTAKIEEDKSDED